MTIASNQNICERMSKYLERCPPLSFFSHRTNLQHFPGPWEPRHAYVFTFSLIPSLLRSPVLSHCLGGGVITQ